MTPESYGNVGDFIGGMLTLVYLAFSYGRIRPRCERGPVDSLGLIRTAKARVADTEVRK